MKPPFRRRTGPSRFLIKSTEEESSVSARSLYKGWNRKDLQKFLQALKQQQNFESALDLTEIQKKVPQRSLKEIEDLIMTLKSRVLQKVYLQVQSQRREERKAKVPVELWAELVQKISRPYEKTISSAFSQMLVIAAIEPCGLMHSDPPHPIIQTPAFSSQHPVQSPKTPSRPSTSDMSPNSSISSPSVASLIQPDSSSNAADHISQLDNTSGSSLVPKMPETPTPRSLQITRSPSQLQSEAEPTASSPISTGPVSPSVSPNKHNQVNLELLDHDYLCKPRMLKSVVNFDKIYQYLSDIDSKTCNSALTSMESAVLLDMLMCLPEELSLLDCKELQHHFLQLHSQLTKPAEMPASSSNSDRDVLQANVADSTALTPKLRPTTGSTKEPSSESSVTEPAKDKKDWAAAGTCPLNPLLVPVALLKTSALDSEK
ncbi:snRNA-activating protein complex subunit 2 [Sinocyclocheilus rhinocerous]|uniref:snRNA-activating protein complex subunit 2 n=1 Tax=Sinocyclocheilus rhinocerous TaxID=307959 RepID=UPI0007B89818|nr:PREDICTED: snRNA-activating protein complex subunit 2-like [Sinocyclocheilus rhinocerous]XP_016426695.1 PREDICTED: snRNA-activating protein complex subunit 2-like [Sinocyclocheilus rhinocerous]XP_016426696.1 PREDICTED: snRNA-activating protein complex subunit 2-like [Sinocyclocheilus rhinocerous]